VPCESRDGTANGLLQVLRDPPIVLLFEVADGDNAGSRANGEFLLRGGPPDECGGAVDAQED
jgi:hypothetical protein